MTAFSGFFFPPYCPADFDATSPATAGNPSSKSTINPSLNPDVGQTAGNDPYAGIFFAKDRREEVVEVQETADSYTFTTRESSSWGEEEMLGPDQGLMKGECVTFSEWMSGCPEKGEQE